MGWLDHSTNNIILDAVLTDYGRQKLAAANEAFNITSYSLGDDEIDYRLIKKYGRSVGKEKIEKNTPIFEALTNQNYALKYKLIGRESDGATLSFTYLPVFTATPANASLSNTVNQNFSTINVELKVNSLLNASSVVEENFMIEVSDRFFTVNSVGTSRVTSVASAQSLISAGDPNRIARYEVTSTTKNLCNFRVAVKPGIDDTTMSIYGKITVDSQNVQKRVISSTVRVISRKYGTTIDIPVTYTK